jgi:hypothetical protein
MHQMILFLTESHNRMDKNCIKKVISHYTSFQAPIIAIYRLYKIRKRRHLFSATQKKVFSKSHNCNKKLIMKYIHLTLFHFMNCLISAWSNTNNFITLNLFFKSLIFFGLVSVLSSSVILSIPICCICDIWRLENNLPFFKGYIFSGCSS